MKNEKLGYERRELRLRGDGNSEAPAPFLCLNEVMTLHDLAASKEATRQGCRAVDYPAGDRVYGRGNIDKHSSLVRKRR